MGCGASSPASSPAANPAARTKHDRRKSIVIERTKAQEKSNPPLESPSSKKRSAPQEPMISPTPKSGRITPESWDWRAAPEITIIFDAKKPPISGWNNSKALGFLLDHQLCVSKVLASSQAETAGVGVGWRLRWVEVTGRDCTWSVPITKVAEVSKAFAECRSRRNKEIVAVFALDQISAAIHYPDNEVFKEENEDDSLA